MDLPFQEHGNYRPAACPNTLISSPTSVKSSRFSSISSTRPVSLSDGARRKQSRTLTSRSSRDMGFPAEPRKALHSALTVEPSFNRAVARTAPGFRAFGLHPDAAQHIFHFGREAAGVGKGIDTHLAVQKGGGGAVFHAELAVQPAAGNGTGVAAALPVDGYPIND